MRIKPGFACALVAALVTLWVPVPAAGFVVNDTGDGSDLALNGVCDAGAAAGQQCTLRAAIEEANAAVGLDTIGFDIPGSGVRTIKPATVFPQITSPVEIDGYTQPGTAPNSLPLARGTNAVLLIQVNGALTPTGGFGNGFDIGAGAGGSSIRGLVINRFDCAGILVRAATTVAGNFIGTSPNGKNAKPNGCDGIFGYDGSILVGSSDRADRNLISGNGDAGVTSNVPANVRGNLIGTARDGRSLLGNETIFHPWGVGLYAGSGNNVGGPGDAANVIAGNDGAGIVLANIQATPLSRNRLFANETIGIDLSEDGRTLNDLGDGDSGPNGLQNFPVLKAATATRRATRVRGRLSSAPSSTFVIELFANPRGGKQAQRYMGMAEVMTDAEGKGAFRKTLRRLRPRQTVTATATSATGATSELSDPVKVRSRR